MFVSIPAFEFALEHLEQLKLDFLLLPGDLTQDGERANHLWLQKRLESLPFPTYVVPGNHDVPTLLPGEQSIGWKDFPSYYQQWGYDNPQQLYYTKEILPGLQLIGLNSNQFDDNGKQLGCLDDAQLIWLEKTLEEVQHKQVIIIVHHNVVEHLPQQSTHELGRRYMLDNAQQLLALLRKFGVKLIFTGHLHIQDIACSGDIYEITTGSLVSYPHPYRLLELEVKDGSLEQLRIESYRVKNLPEWENLQKFSREWIGDRSYPFMIKLLTGKPLNLPLAKAEELIPQLRYFWADISAGDGNFYFPDFPPQIQHYFQQFGADNNNKEMAFIDNQAILRF